MGRCRTDKERERERGGVCDLLQRSPMHDYGRGDQNKVARK